jgi:histone H2A
MEHFETYIRAVLRQVQPDMRISKESLHLVNDIVNLLALHLQQSAVMLTQPLNYEATTPKVPVGKKTISSRDIQAAVGLVLPGELVKHAKSQGAKAVTRYASCASKPKDSTKKMMTCTKADLQFSVSRTAAILRRHISLRIGETAPVYLAAVLEYICAEILELAGNHALNKRMKTILPRHIKEIVIEDEELYRLMKHLHVVLPGVKDQNPKMKFADALAYLT